MNIRTAVLGLALMYTSCATPSVAEQGTAQQISVPSLEQATLDTQDGRITQVTAENFDKIVLRSSRPIVVDFYATWCGHCKNMEQPYQRAADAMSGRMTFTKYDIDSNRSIPQQYHITGIPTFVVFNDGQEICRIVGTRPNIQRDLENCLD